MIWRALLAIIAIVCLLTAGYNAWLWHRTSPTTLARDRAWPRDWPYPDKQLLAWNDALDKQYPAGRFIKIHGERDRILWILSVRVSALVLLGTSYGGCVVLSVLRIQTIPKVAQPLVKWLALAGSGQRPNFWIRAANGASGIVLLWLLIWHGDPIANVRLWNLAGGAALFVFIGTAALWWERHFQPSRPTNSVSLR